MKKTLRAVGVMLASSVAVCSSVSVAYGDDFADKSGEQTIFRWNVEEDSGGLKTVYSDLPPTEHDKHKIKNVSVVETKVAVVAGRAKGLKSDEQYRVQEKTKDGNNDEKSGTGDKLEEQLKKLQSVTDRLDRAQQSKVSIVPPQGEYS